MIQNHLFGGADEGWHVKLPDPQRVITRRELRLPLARPRDPVPEELAYLVMAYTRGAPLRPVARIETRRRRTTLHNTAGESLAYVVANEVVAQSLGASTTVSRWDEIEVELTGGSRKLLRATDKRAGGRAACGRPATKLELTLPADLPTPRDTGGLTPRSLGGDVVLGYLAAQTARLKSLDPAVRRDEPDAVHQMRVTTRRLRSTLQAFREIVPADATRHLRDELKRLGRVLGDAREGEVLSELLRADLADTPTEPVMGPAQARIRAHFAPRQAAARAAVLQALDSPAYFAMLDDLDRLLGDPPLTSTAARPGGKVLPGAVARSYRRTTRRMRHALRAPAGPARDAALHEARKAAKRARYAAEAARPAAGKKARRFAKRMKGVQSVLGDHQDAVNACAVARELGVHPQLPGRAPSPSACCMNGGNRGCPGHYLLTDAIVVPIRAPK
jgi:CHAD domain-containing protein